MRPAQETTCSGDPRAITVLVTPVWRDSARLEGFGLRLAEVLAARLPRVDWVIADDGSGEEEGRRLEELCRRFAAVHPRVSLHRAREHRGKGAVIREAWRLQRGADWLAFVDADGSVSANDLADLLEAAWGSRRSTLAIRRNTERTEVVEGPWRSLRHHGFVLAFRLLLGISAGDPQCGAKVVRARDFRQVAGELEEDGYAFDAELLAQLHAAGCVWDERPISWVRVSGSRIDPWRDAARMLRALFRIRRRLG